MKKSGVKRIVRFKHRLKKAHYVADAVVVWCFDFRFSDDDEENEKAVVDALRELRLARNFKKIDLLSFAGGAKALVPPFYNDDWEFVFSQIETSLRLHHTKRIVLMVHSDCGAYGGLAAFGNDPKKEKEALIRDLRAARKALLANLRMRKGQKIVPVDLIFVDFDGIDEVSA